MYDYAGQRRIALLWGKQRVPCKSHDIVEDRAESFMENAQGGLGRRYIYPRRHLKLRKGHQKGLAGLFGL